MDQASSSESSQDPGSVLRGLGVFRTADAERHGVSQPTVSRLAANGTLVRLGWGIYHHRDADVDVATVDYAVATLRFGPDAVIGGLTALFHYVLIEQVPQQVWVMVPQSVRGRVPPLFRLLRTKHDPKVAVVDHGSYRLATAERAVVEAFCYATKIGLATAVAAGRTALREGKATEKSLWEIAEALGRQNVLRQHWEALTIR